MPLERTKQHIHKDYNRNKISYEEYQATRMNCKTIRAKEA